MAELIELLNTYPKKICSKLFLSKFSILYIDRLSKNLDIRLNLYAFTKEN